MLRPGGLLNLCVPIWNSLQAVDSDAAIVATYDKHHLPNYGVFDEKRVSR